jgi:hypothetical protein
MVWKNFVSEALFETESYTGKAKGERKNIGGKGKGEGPAALPQSLLTALLLSRCRQEHIPRPATKLRVMDILDLRAVAKLVAVPIGSFRLFIFEV